MKTEFEGWVILDPDSEPMFFTMVEGDSTNKCVQNYLTISGNSWGDWETMLLKGYQCVKFKMQIEA